MIPVVKDNYYYRNDDILEKPIILFLLTNRFPGFDSCVTPPQWQLVCDEEWKVHIAKFSLLVGSIFGYLLMGAMADW